MLSRWENPIFIQSSRRQMRRGKAYGCLVAYLSVLTAVVLVVYDQLTRTAQPTSGVAQSLFEALSLTQWFIIAFVAPGLTANAITLEREQRTYDLLIMSPLSRFSIVWGKFLSAAAFIVVMIGCGLPMVSLLFLLGGVDVGAVLGRYAAMFATGIILAAFGLMVSAVCATSLLASLLTYGALLNGYFGAFFSGLMWVLSQAFGGTLLPPLTFATLFPSVWIGWLLVSCIVAVSTLLLLQIAANYLLPDPRTAAWKTRLWLSGLFLLLLGTAIAASRNPSLASLPLGTNISVILVLSFLSSVMPTLVTGVPLTKPHWVEWLSLRSLKVGSVQSALLFVWLLLAVAMAVDWLFPPSLRSGWVAWLCAAAYCWWIWTLGYFISWQIRNRWGALATLVGVMYVLSLAPGLLAEATGWRLLSQGTNLAFPNLFFMQQTVSLAGWAVTYLLAGGLMVALEELFERRKRRRRAEGSA